MKRLMINYLITIINYFMSLTDMLTYYYLSNNWYQKLSRLTQPGERR